MQVQPLSNNSFGSKNTFLRKSHRALNPDDKNLYKSLHYEAKSRLHYLKFQRAVNEIENIEEDADTIKGFFSLAKILCIIAKEKIASAMNEGDAFRFYPLRFLAPDNKNALPHRYYKTNKLM